MSDVGISDVAEEPQVSTPTTVLTAGTMLRHAREAAGLHVAALAVSMKIPVKKLEALEADRLDLLHDAVFVRALAASVCRTLKIDPAPVLDKLPQNTAPKLTSVERGINAPFHQTNYAKGMTLPEFSKRPSTLAFFALILAGIAVFFLPAGKVSDLSGLLEDQAMAVSGTADTLLGSQTSIAVTSDSAQATPLNTARSATPDIASGLTATTAAASVVGESQAVAPPAPGVALAASEAVNLPSVAASSPSVVASLPTTGTVVFKARAETWVKVVDAKGFVQLSKTLSGGEVVGASGAMPLTVVIGRVDATDVEVRGQAFNLTSVSRDNVARFEVK